MDRHRAVVLADGGLIGRPDVLVDAPLPFDLGGRCGRRIEFAIEETDRVVGEDFDDIAGKPEGCRRPVRDIDLLPAGLVLQELLLAGSGVSRDQQAKDNDGKAQAFHVRPPLSLNGAVSTLAASLKA